MFKQISRFSQAGFTLVEVMIALTIFAIFASALLVSLGYNVSDSVLNEEQLKLQYLCENKMNEMLVNPPRLTNANKDTKETKTFEEKEYSNYSYTVELKTMKVPDFGKIFRAQATSKGEGDGDGGEANYYNSSTSGQGQSKGIEELIFQRMKENMERVLWQVRITVTNKETKYSFALSRWIPNYDEQIRLNLNF